MKEAENTLKIQIEFRRQKQEARDKRQEIAEGFARNGKPGGSSNSGNIFRKTNASKALFARLKAK